MCIKYRKKFEIKRLSIGDKELIAYRNFENKIYHGIAKVLVMDIITFRIKLGNIILKGNSKVYWKEKKFWASIHGENCYN